MIKAEKPTFFIDRALGRKYVADALRNAGAKVEVHEDHFLPDAPDTEWLPEVSQRGWLILTKDDAIGRNILEQVAIANVRQQIELLQEYRTTLISDAVTGKIDVRNWNA